MALVTANISTSLVAQTIQENSSDVGTLCKSTKINKWSRKKPITQPNVVLNRNSDWYKAVDLGCNLEVNSFAQWANGENIPTAFYDFILRKNSSQNTIADWKYKYLLGGASDPFRIADFGGYEHTPRQPVIQYAGTEIIGTSYMAIFFDFIRGGANRDTSEVPAKSGYNINYGVVSGILSPSEITLSVLESGGTITKTNLGDLYPCVVFNGNIYITNQLTGTGEATLLYNGATKQFTNIDSLSNEPLTFNEAESRSILNKSGTNGFAVAIPRPTTLTNVNIYPCLYRKPVYENSILVKSGRFFALPTAPNDGLEDLDFVDFLPYSPRTELVQVSVSVETNIPNIQSARVMLELRSYAQWNYVDGNLSENNTHGTSYQEVNISLGTSITTFNVWVYKYFASEYISWNGRIQDIQLRKTDNSIISIPGNATISVQTTVGGDVDNVTGMNWWGGDSYSTYNGETAVVHVTISQ